MWWRALGTRSFTGGFSGSADFKRPRTKVGKDIPLEKWPPRRRRVRKWNLCPECHWRFGWLRSVNVLAQEVTVTVSVGQAEREIFQMEVGPDDLEILIQTWDDVILRPITAGWGCLIPQQPSVEYHLLNSFRLWVTSKRRDQKTSEEQLEAYCTEGFVSKLLWVKGTSDPALQTATCLLIRDK